MPKLAVKTRTHTPKANLNGMGSVYQRAGRPGWTCAISERDEKGRSVRKCFSAPTASEAIAKRDRHLIAKGLPPKKPPQKQAANDSVLTLTRCAEEFLADTKETCEPTTLADYRNTLKQHVLPRLGACGLSDLTTTIIKNTLADIKRDVSPSMEARARRTLHNVLQFAIREGYLDSNPANLPRPRPSRKMQRLNGSREKVRTPSQEQCAAIIAAAEHDRLGSLFTIAITCGLRWGELAGLRYADIDFDKRTLTVNQCAREVWHVKNGKEVFGVELIGDAKTPTSTNRVIDLPQCAIDALRSRLAIAKQEKKNVSDRDLIFCTPKGAPLRRSNFNRNVFQAIRKKAGCPWATMHSLRHAMSSILASHLASAKHIAERLGHRSGVRLTLDRYTHLDRASQAQAASIFDDVFASKKGTLAV
jgi:integrase